MANDTMKDISAKAKCPFYAAAHDADGNGNRPRISCEGVCEWSCIQNVFRDKKKFREYAEGYCCGNYRKCLINQMLERFKYGEDGTKENEG